MKAFVTGSNGFIGNHLVERLETSGITVVRIKRQLLHRMDLLKYELQKHEPDYIFHLAAYGNHAYQKDIRHAFDSNVVATMNLLEATSTIPYKAFINFGSSSEYGRQVVPMKEYMQCFPKTAYEVTKYQSTLLAQYFAREYHKPICTVRPFSVYGEGEAQHRFIPSVVYALENHVILPLYKEGRHDWIYIDDFIEGVKTIVTNIKKLQGDVVNIGTGVETSNRDIVSYIEQLTEKKVKTIPVQPLSEHQSPMWCADVTKLKVFNWKPKVSLAQGLSRTIEYYQKLYEQ